MRSSMSLVLALSVDMLLSRSCVGDINADYCTCGKAGNDYRQGCHTDLTKNSLMRRIVRIKVYKLPWS